MTFRRPVSSRAERPDRPCTPCRRGAGLLLAAAFSIAVATTAEARAGTLVAGVFREGSGNHTSWITDDWDDFTRLYFYNSHNCRYDEHSGCCGPITFGMRVSVASSQKKKRGQV